MNIWDILENLCGIKSVIEYISVVHKLTSFLKTMMKDASFLQKTFFDQINSFDKTEKHDNFSKNNGQIINLTLPVRPYIQSNTLLSYFYIFIFSYFHNLSSVFIDFIIVSLWSERNRNRYQNICMSWILSQRDGVESYVESTGKRFIYELMMSEKLI